jgi:hypothetical protein
MMKYRFFLTNRLFFSIVSRSKIRKSLQFRLQADTVKSDSYPRRTARLRAELQTFAIYCFFLSFLQKYETAAPLMRQWIPAFAGMTES